jgi:hypothetical protein
VAVGCGRGGSLAGLVLAVVMGISRFLSGKFPLDLDGVGEVIVYECRNEAGVFTLVLEFGFGDRAREDCSRGKGSL